MIGQRLRQASTRLQAGWQACTPRERQLLAAAAVGLALLAASLLVDWLQVERQRLERALPLAEARLLRLQAAAEEHSRLREQAGAARPAAGAARPAAGARLDAVRAAARERGLRMDIQASADGWQASGQGSADAVLAWLAEIAGQHAWRPLRLELTGNRFSATLIEATEP